MDSLTPVVSSHRPAYVYRHIVTFEETNLMGNVYYARHIEWQGRCRELFLREHVRELLDEMTKQLRLVTIEVNCEYYAELQAFDEIELQMRLAFVRQHRIGLSFDYFKIKDSFTQPIARGRQELGCMRLASGGLTPTPPPKSFLEALRPYGC